MSNKEIRPHHILGCKDCNEVDEPAYYYPSFYVMKFTTGIDIEELIQKLRDRVTSKTDKLTNDEIEAWFHFCHEYVHFLQDLRCSRLRQNALQHLRTAIGLEDNNACDCDEKGERMENKLEIKECKEENGEIQVICYNHVDVKLTECALAEAIASIIEDRLKNAGAEKRQPTWHSIPYDLPLWVTQWAIKDVPNQPPREKLEELLLDICEASLMTEYPARSFWALVRSEEFLKDIDKMDFQKAIGWFKLKHIMLCKQSYDTFKAELKGIFPTRPLDTLASALCSKIDAFDDFLKDFSEHGYGLFRLIITGGFGTSIANSIAHCVNKVGYPLICDKQSMLCGEKDSNVWQYALSLITLYDTACGEKEVCQMLEFCTSGAAKTHSSGKSTMPIVSDFCKTNPYQISLDTANLCPLGCVKKIRCENMKNKGCKDCPSAQGHCAGSDTLGGTGKAPLTQQRER